MWMFFLSGKVMVENGLRAVAAATARCCENAVARSPLSGDEPDEGSSVRHLIWLCLSWWNKATYSYSKASPTWCWVALRVRGVGV